MSLRELGFADAESEEAREVAAAIRERRGAGGLLNLDRVLLHNPGLAAGWSHYMGQVRGGCRGVPGDLRELLICHVAVLNGAEYEWQQHAGEYAREGGDRGKLEALRAMGSAEPAEEQPPFLPLELLALRLCHGLTCRATAEPRLRSALLEQLGERGYVELAHIVCSYNMVSRFLLATGVPLEGPS